ncbi:MAG TPA: HupE/UreJ family protein [Burkholderiales bacterium]|jgi:urease accessory protein
MVRQVIYMLVRAAALFAATASLALAHHAMDYAMPASALEGLLSGLGHPVIGVDHLLFMLGAGVLAARWQRGWILPLLFVMTSLSAAGLRAAGASFELGEIWIAVTLIALGAILLAARNPRWVEAAALFIASGALHGYALAEAIVGAETTPLSAYFAGLAMIQSAMALAAWWIASWFALRRPRVPLQRLAGAAIGIAGLAFAGIAALG